MSDMYPDDIDLEQLEREVPVLSRLRRFADGLELIPWFSRLGEPLSRSTRQLADDYLDRLGFPGTEVAVLPSWDEAAAASETFDWSSPAWEAEELARADLTGRALEAISEEALQLGLSVVSDKAGHAVKSALLDTAALWDMVDEEVHNLSVGSAVQTTHNAALTLLAAAVDPDLDPADHLFALKFRLFEQGRWPVSVIGSSFNIF
ncbi:hypothetical protein FF098_008820 [Parvularcula flava]|uniref:Uncharacterized protein n=2 Tax=Aquisalinus luteolus TaxID=1566827 RepID=A0ABX0HLB0_9PROT|nr:hypothetical protein [Aquisalinus luteolus]